MLERAARSSASPPPQVSEAADRAHEGLDLTEIIVLIRQYFATIALSVVLAIAVAFAYVMLVSPIYTARSQLLIDPRASLPREQTGEVSFSLDAAQVETHIAVMRSEKIVRAVVKKLGLEHDPELARATDSIFTGALSRLAFRSKSGDDDFVRSRRVIAAFEAGLTVRRVGLSYAIEISFSSTDPEKAARIVNATADEYVRDQIETKSASAREASLWLEQRLAELRGQMNEATHRVQEFRARYDYSIGRVQNNGGDAKGQSPAVANTRGEPSLEEFETTAETYRKIYESFLQAYMASVQRQSYPAFDARVITPASRPLRKSHPRTLLVLSLAALIGSMLGFGLAVVRHKIAIGTHATSSA
jgi:uncharacterized protein involved in exopolysaccharide biosynthesis